MSASSRFFPRAPRYTLRAQDDNQMRFALMQTRGNALDTVLHDVSSSGLKFSVFKDEVPSRGLDEGDIIKIEFRIPSGKQIACFATVVRVEPSEQWHRDFGQQNLTEIAVQFRHLPTAFANALKKSLPKEEQHATISVLDQSDAQISSKSLFYFFLSSVALLGMFFFLSYTPQQWLHWFIR